MLVLQAAFSAGCGSEHCRLCSTSPPLLRVPWVCRHPPIIVPGPCPGGEIRLAACVPWEAECHSLTQDLPRSSQAGLFHIPVPIQSFITNSISPAKISRQMPQAQSLIGSAAAPHKFHILQFKIALSEMCHVRMAFPKPLPRPGSVSLEHYSNMWSPSGLSLQETFPLAIFLCGRAQLIQTQRKMLLNLFQTSRCVGAFINSALPLHHYLFFYTAPRTYSKFTPGPMYLKIITPSKSGS